MKIFRDLFDGLDPFGRFWLALGLGSLAAAAAMSFDFGYGVSIKHALFLAILSVVAAFGPMAAEMLFSKGRKGPAIATGLICIPLLGIEFYSHAGYTAGLRGTNIETATVQNTRYDGAQDGVKEAKASLVLFEKRLSDLEAANQWAPTVNAEALRAQLASANLAIDLESKRGGCKAKCLERTKERDTIASRIAIAEERSSLTGQIEATKRVIAGARDKANTTEHKSSAVDHQNKSLKKWVALAYNGSTTVSDLQAEAAEQSANLAMAIAGTGLPAFALFMASLFRRPEDERTPQTLKATRDSNGNLVYHHHTERVIENPAIKEMLREWGDRQAQRLTSVKGLTTA